MEVAEDNVITKPFKEALDVLEEAEALNFIRRNHVNQQQAEDEEDWAPSEVLKICPQLTTMQVELVGPETNLNKLNKQLVRAQNVGLVLMGPSIGRNSKPLLILLTTQERIYALDPEDTQRSMRFLGMKLRDNQVSIWTSNGLWEADCLYNNYQIDLLHRPNLNCCMAEHVSIMKTIRALTRLGRALYPAMADFTASRWRNIRLASFESMVEIWLDIDQKLIAYDPEQLENLKVRPLNLTAINLIKKRCCLVLPLAQRLNYYAWKQNQVTSQRVFSRLIVENDKLRRCIREMLRDSSSVEVDPAMYEHLDNGCG